MLLSRYFKILLFRSGGPSTFHDKVFVMEMNRQLIQSHEAYEKLLFKEALRTGFFELQAARDKYQLLCGETAMCRQLVLQYIEWQAIVLSPICPHVAEHVWELLGHKVRYSIPARLHGKRQYFAYTQCRRQCFCSPTR